MPQSEGPHPFKAAWKTRDLDAWAGAMAPGVVLHSPVIRSPFVGREAAVELYGVLFDTFGDVDITDEFTVGSSHAFFWQADVGGRRIEGADLIKTDGEGKVAEARLMALPLGAFLTLADVVASRLVQRRG